MFFTLDVRRARKGDCLVLHYGSADDPGLALIDGGPANVYKPFLKPRLDEIRKMRAGENYLERLDLGEFKRANSWETTQGKFLTGLERLRGVK